MKKITYLFLLFSFVFLFSCQDEKNNQSKSSDNEGDNKMVEIRGTGFTTELPEGFQYKKDVFSIWKNGNCNLTYMFADATPMPDKETAQSLSEANYYMEVKKISEEKFWGYDGYKIDGKIKNSDIKITIILFGTNEFVGLIVAKHKTKAEKKIIKQVLSTLQFDKSKLNSNISQFQNNVDLSISGFKFASNMSGTEI